MTFRDDAKLCLRNYWFVFFSLKVAWISVFLMNMPLILTVNRTFISRNKETFSCIYDQNKTFSWAYMKIIGLILGHVSPCASLPGSIYIYTNLSWIDSAYFSRLIIFIYLERASEPLPPIFFHCSTLNVLLMNTNLYFVWKCLQLLNFFLRENITSHAYHKALKICYQNTKFLEKRNHNFTP